jgi:transcriptional regulator with XRE-family HTH domain
MGSRNYSQEQFGPTLEVLMRDQGVTFRQLARKTDLSAGYLNHLVHGNRPFPSDDVVTRIAEALGKHPDFFGEYRARQVGILIRRHPEKLDRVYRMLTKAA